MNSSKQESRFRDLLQRNHARWVGIARCYAAPSQRDDLLQEIMMQIWKSLGRFEGRSSIDTWAYRIALNTALAWDRTSRKRAGNFKSSSKPVDQLAGELESESNEIKVLDEFLPTLSKADRAVMLLFLDNVSNAEAAEITGITEGALRVRQHRVRKKFEQAYCDREASK